MPGRCNASIPQNSPNPDAVVSNKSSKELAEVLVGVLTSPDETSQMLAEVIRTLARHVRYIPVRARDRDLEILLSLSIALTQSKRHASY